MQECQISALKQIKVIIAQNGDLVESSITRTLCVCTLTRTHETLGHLHERTQECPLLYNIKSDLWLQRQTRTNTLMLRLEFRESD